MKTSWNYLRGSENPGQPYRQQRGLFLLTFATAGILLLLLLVCLPDPGVAALRPPVARTEYCLEVSFDLPRGKIRGQAVIQAPPGQKLVIHPGELTLTTLTATGRRKALNSGGKGEPLVLFPRGPVHLTYEATLKSAGENRITADGLVLQGEWYPRVEGFCRFKLTATLPAGFEAISEADRISKEEKAGQALFHFDFPYPRHDSTGLTLVASNRFVTAKTTYGGVELWTYLLPEEAPLAAGYLERTKVLLKKYENRFGPFPYRRFAVVESSLTFSLSLPTYVVLNREILQKKDSEDATLDHELVHQWFGCSVVPDFEGGNWCEGIATYFSDHLRAEEKNAAWIYRRQLLAECQKQLPRVREFPLGDFTVGVGPPTRSIGYDKGTLVFHMLRRQVGDRAFAAAIRKFFLTHRSTVASWTDLHNSFERATGRNLSWFFRQWVDEVGQPEITIKKIGIDYKNRLYAVNLVLGQEGQPKRLSLPVTFQGREGERNFQVELDRREKRFVFQLHFKPEAVVVDKDYSVFRVLLPGEVPAARAASPAGENGASDSENSPRGIRRPVNFY